MLPRWWRLGGVVLVILAVLALTRWFGPMADLRDRYASKHPAPTSVERVAKVVLQSPEHRGAFTFRGVRRAFTDSGIYLSTSPFGLGAELWIPRDAIVGCVRTDWAGGPHETGVWVADAQVLINFPDSNDRLVGWCRERGIALVDTATKVKWLRWQ